MKTPNLFILLLLFTILLSSCSTNETLLLEEDSNLLDTYIISRDESGTYALDYILKENIQTEIFLDQVQTRKIFICIHRITIQVAESLRKI